MIFDLPFLPHQVAVGVPTTGSQKKGAMARSVFVFHSRKYVVSIRFPVFFFSAASALVVAHALGPHAGALLRHATVGTPVVRGLIPARGVHHALVRVAVIANLRTRLPVLSGGP